MLITSCTYEALLTLTLSDTLSQSNDREPSAFAVVRPEYQMLGSDAGIKLEEASKIGTIAGRILASILRNELERELQGVEGIFCTGQENKIKHSNDVAQPQVPKITTTSLTRLMSLQTSS